MTQRSTARLHVVTGDRCEDRPVLHPTTPIAARAGITPVGVPADMWVSPALVRAMAPRRHLRAVA